MRSVSGSSTDDAPADVRLSVSRPLRALAALLLVAYLGLLAVATLSPQPSMASDVVARVADVLTAVGVPADLVVPGRVEAVLNTAMVVPATLLASVVWPRPGWRDWTAAGFVVSLGVEVVQAIWLPARSAQAVDVVTNTAGAFLGALVGALVARGPRRSREVGSRRTARKGGIPIENREPPPHQ
ncbi:hypothetical protein GCM10011519_16990 [Marmoricola endophyticus]|uniref:VanZ-like domain-containing protein n=1 Tax=Marmoricola endophyticus TaxID=2040280 RepID=A0A917BJL2_9ACTN|nr:VanZ family protein [Marmoricola endophyticus]GGF43729.1 hypothetical protein GCM10011519_16990 [Marmoricola endophyticus]